MNSYKIEGKENYGFPDLLEDIALINPLLRVRFATSHPKDISDTLIKTIAKHPNICRAIHLPVQSGSSKMLKLMNRKYTREWYLDRIASIKKHIPDCAISTDIIAGFCDETQVDHEDTLSMMKEVGYDYAFMFKYSERPDTLASKKLKDNIPEKVKGERLTEIIELQQQLSLASNKKNVGQVFEVLVEGTSKKSEEQLYGRNSQNKVIVFPKENFKVGDYVRVKVKDCTSATLIGEAV